MGDWGTENSGDLPKDTPQYVLEIGVDSRLPGVRVNVWVTPSVNLSSHTSLILTYTPALCKLSRPIPSILHSLPQPKTPSQISNDN